MFDYIIKFIYFPGIACVFRLAEREGFEPPDPLGSTVFKTAAFDHSATSPLQSIDPGFQGLEG